MLNDGAVHAELVFRVGRGGLGLGDEGLEDGVDDGVVPFLCLRVVVGGSGGESRVACVIRDLTEPGG